MAKILNGVSKDAVSIFALYEEAQRESPENFDLSLTFSENINYANIFKEKRSAELFLRRLKPVIYKLRDNMIFEKTNEPIIRLIFNADNDTVTIHSNIEYTSTNIDERCLQIMSVVTAEVTKLCMAYYTYTETKYPFSETRQYTGNDGKIIDHMGEDVPFFVVAGQPLTT